VNLPAHSSALVTNFEALHILQVVRVAESFRIFSTVAVSKLDTSESAGFYLTSFKFSISLLVFTA